MFSLRYKNVWMDTFSKNLFRTRIQCYKNVMCYLGPPPRSHWVRSPGLIYIFLCILVNLNILKDRYIINENNTTLSTST